MLFKLILLIFWLCEIDSLEVAPHVEISSGEIEGLVDKSVTGRQFYSFEGIPYAEPPIGENRFKPPVPKKPWKGCLKANTQYACIQEQDFIPSSDGKQTIIGSEDCLFVNVYTPNLEGNLDVLVYIHGGAFVLGFSGLIQPRILMDRDVVLVSLNYRLGALGFLSTEDDILPGNDGLRDQILALKWIKENIKLFGETLIQLRSVELLLEEQVYISIRCHQNQKVYFTEPYLLAAAC
ncbi:hypothetical protein WA026_005165 [Henosepilachna vigintioctopunctata]|uniref:Carboxylesterase type B domain-containing protein n=1 Tax=Henosepilachna vigintioctopunctata TaxID=420089 RepID=A0AAW1UNX7_9CUCU